MYEKARVLKYFVTEGNVHREIESGVLLLAYCPDSIKPVMTYAIAFIFKGEMRQNRRSCGRMEG